jgi:hypothetical protein
MAPLNFEAKVDKVGPLAIILLPKSESQKLPSRGMTLVQGTINGKNFKTPLEPDGKGSHWLKVDKALVGTKVKVDIEPTKDWPEPEVPKDLLKALTEDIAANELWHDITPMARWDWIRWVGSTKNPETRNKHVEVACSKLKAGIRRPCCFNRAACTDQSVSKNGILMS